MPPVLTHGSSLAKSDHRIAVHGPFTCAEQRRNAPLLTSLPTAMPAPASQVDALPLMTSATISTPTSNPLGDRDQPHDRHASLGAQERAVLTTLLANRGRVVGRRELARGAGLAELSPRRCDSVLVGLRRALGNDAIVTVRSRGWMLNPAVEDSAVEDSAVKSTAATLL